MKVAMLLSCSSFEGFYGHIQGYDRERYLREYRSDWSWYYGAGLIENGIEPIFYIPSIHEAGRYHTDTGIDIRFLPLASWYRPIEKPLLKKFVRRTRWSLYLDERMNALAFLDPLRVAMAEDGIDQLYMQEYWSGRFDHLVGRLGVPVSAADHGGLSKGVFKMFKRDAFGKAVLCYCQTRRECDIVESYGGRTKLHPNGCDVDRFAPPDEPRTKKTILTVARLTNGQKRTTDLIRALSILPEDWSLDIVGTGPHGSMMKELATRLGLDARVRFHGFMGRDAVREHMRRCGVYAMPSSNEAVAIAALEAMGCGASVVLTRIRAFEELVEDGRNGTLVPVADVEELAAGISRAFEHREARGDAARHTVVERFNSRLLYRELARALRETTPSVASRPPVVEPAGLRESPAERPAGQAGGLLPPQP